MRWAYQDKKMPQGWVGWGRYHNGKSWHRYIGISTLCGIYKPPVQTRELPAPYYRICKKCQSLLTNKGEDENG